MTKSGEEFEGIPTDRKGFITLAKTAEQAKLWNEMTTAMKKVPVIFL